MPGVDTDEFRRGQADGRTEQRLDDHHAHLTRINGSIERSAAALLTLTSEVRSLREDARIDRERVIVAATTLATETERRRVVIADDLTADTSKFTRRERVLAGMISMAGLSLTALAAVNQF